MAPAEGAPEVIEIGTTIPFNVAVLIGKTLVVPATRDLNCKSDPTLLLKIGSPNPKLEAVITSGVGTKFNTSSILTFLLIREGSVSDKSNIGSTSVSIGVFN
jgi:hypothetical protein